MEREKVAKLLSDNLKNIFAFSLSRLYDRSEAEDLTNDIICEVLKCARGLKNDDAFYGFMWRIAENTFKKRIRKSNFQTIEFDESFVGTYWATPEEEYLKTEELHLLRRELWQTTKGRSILLFLLINIFRHLQNGLRLGPPCIKGNLCQGFSHRICRSAIFFCVRNIVKARTVWNPVGH